ncbi:unnamed protein product [Adineta steineri]|uniref:rhomboid protease n=1 Tax=Adineta steineri TaxID=433720 RepID=A0A814V010_9BILA|nr:unnamed protein product [Adineta steineri]CAF1183197.1 unnamed protein product [Adineta steineri]
MEESIVIEDAKPTVIKKNNICSWLRRIVNIDDEPNQKHYYAVFIIGTGALQVFIYLLTYINIIWKGERFWFTLSCLFMFFVPCMRPTSDYDDRHKGICFSFMYPHQLWRFFTAVLFHMSWYHLLSNISKQLLYGFLLERKYGSVRVVILYWLSNLSACLSFMLKNRNIASMGASGSIYGLMIFFVMDRLVAIQEKTKRRLFILLQIFLLVILPNVPTMIVFSILELPVGHSAHFGGGLVGFLLGVAEITSETDSINSRMDFGFPCARFRLIQRLNKNQKRNRLASAFFAGSSWTLIYSGSTGLETDPGRYTCAMVQLIDNSIQYRSYRFLVTGKRSTSYSVQYSEVILFGY